MVRVPIYKYIKSLANEIKREKQQEPETKKKKNTGILCIKYAIIYSNSVFWGHRRKCQTH